MIQARTTAACDLHGRASPGSRCVAAISQCPGGCDICRFLAGTDELKAVVADEDEWAPITRVPRSIEAPNGYAGHRATEEVGLFSRRYRLNWSLCNDKELTDVLASTIVHEAIHACASVTGVVVLDQRFHPPRGCSAEELENACASK